MFYYFDWTYLILVMPAFFFALWASSRVKSTFRKYQQQHAARGITAADVTRHILDSNGLRHIQVERVAGHLTDHYDPKAQVIRLSDSVYNSTSTAAIGVAAHEAGHAVQHANHYAPLTIRNAIVPLTSFGSKAAVPLLILGLILSAMDPLYLWVAYAGLICFGLCVVFQLVTLPTEFNASKRALGAIETYNVLQPDELVGAKKVLWAAAMTYVAALAVSLAQLLRFLLLILARGGGRRD